MPHVIVKLWPGKSERQKTQLAERITWSVMEMLHYGPESVSVAKDWASNVYHADIVGNEDKLYKKPG